jgi:hypothetical protein
MTENKSLDSSETSSAGQREPSRDPASSTMYRPSQPKKTSTPSKGSGCGMMAFGGFAFLVSLLIVSAIMALIGNFGMMSNSLVTAVAGVALFLIVVGNIAVWKYLRWRMFVYGYLIGFGVLALALGVCIAIMSSVRFS